MSNKTYKFYRLNLKLCNSVACKNCSPSDLLYETTLTFLEFLVERSDTSLSTTCYHKPTDTVLRMNFHAVARTRYKRSILALMMYKFYRSCSSWSLLNGCFKLGMSIIEKNQCLTAFYNPND